MVSSKVVGSSNEAIADLADGATVALTGFGLSKGIASSLIVATRDSGVRDLTIVCNSLGSDGSVRAQMLVKNRQVRKLICSFSSRPGLHTAADDQIRAGELDVELVPQGILVERLRAAGAGIAAFYSPTGVGTSVAEGKERRTFGERSFILEQALPVEFTFARAWRADTVGNVEFRGSNIHFNVSMAKAARTTVVEVDEIVKPGEIPPERVGLPGIFVDRVVQSTVSVDAARGTIRLRRPADEARTYLGKPAWTRREMAGEVLSLLDDGSYVNIGSGMPALIASCIQGHGAILHGENGILGYGGVAEGDDVDPDLFDAGGNQVLVRDGASFFDSVTSFEMGRGRGLDTVVLGAYQVDADGNIASHSLGDSRMGGIGGAMDLIVAKRRLIVMMEHRDSKDRAKLVRNCTLPLTGLDCVDVIVTDLAVLVRTADGFMVERTAPGFTAAEVGSLAEMPVVA